MTGGAADGGYRLHDSVASGCRDVVGGGRAERRSSALLAVLLPLRYDVSCRVSSPQLRSQVLSVQTRPAPGPSGALAVSQGDLRSEGVHGAFCSHVVGSCGASTYAFRPTQYIRSVDRPKIATLDVVCRMPQLRASSARRESLAAVERREAESATSSMNLSTPCMRL